MTFLDEIERRGERRGERRAERRGELRGEHRMLVYILLKQLAARFGAVPAKLRERIQAADSATLYSWAVRVLTAPTAEAVLDQGAAPASPRRRAAPRKRARAAR